MQEKVKIPAHKQPALRIKARPNEANPAGDIFGGWLMSQIDIAGGIVAAERAKGPVATVAVKSLVLLKPLYVYDLVSFYPEIVKVGHSSITIEVEVFAHRHDDMSEVFKVSEATLVYVAVSEPGVKRPVPAANAI